MIFSVVPPKGEGKTAHPWACISLFTNVPVLLNKVSRLLHQVLQGSLEGVKEEGKPPTMKTYLVILGLLFLLKKEGKPAN